MARLHHPPPALAETAVADLVQRCLDGGATQVDVAVEFAGAASWIRVAAAGAADLALQTQAADPAAATTPSGLDLAAAGLALGSHVTVASTARGEGGWALRRRFDDSNGDHGHGAVAIVEPCDVERAALDLGGAEGTVVMIEGLHEVLAYKRREGRVIEAVVDRLCARLVETLGLAFHRGIAGVARRRGPVPITVNAVPVPARHPFAAEHQPLRLRRRELPFVAGHDVEAVTATPYVLAPFEDDPARGRQGFFVYLSDRLIQAGGWSRLNVAGRGDGLARIAVELPGEAAGAFGWEPAARRVLFPVSLVPALRALAYEAVIAPMPQLPTATG